eukprot:jgi/Bigna1/42563/e_gw1.65.18.1
MNSLQTKVGLTTKASEASIEADIITSEKQGGGTLATSLRSHSCGELTIDDVGKEVRLQGWASSVRDKGGLLFILLRDRYGITQATISEKTPEDVRIQAKQVRPECVVEITGIVSKRDDTAVNPDMKTGKVEVLASDVKIISRTGKLPFSMNEGGKDGEAKEETRLRYRYLDLRRNPMQRALQMRHRAAMSVRNYLDSQDFLEIETPVLCRATPEGARDYLVPSRVHPGEWFALPQSPQMYKQSLMVSGYDRYFQIVRCFRDEDLRADRQPEFTQIDIEMAHVTSQDIMRIGEGVARAMWKNTVDYEIPEIPRITYDEAMRRFGVDNPDTRFEMELCDLTENDVIKDSSFAPLQDAEMVKAFVVPGGAGDTSRKTLDSYTAFVKSYGLTGLLYGSVTVSGPISKIVADESSTQQQEQLENLLKSFNAGEGDLVLMAAGPASAVNAGLGRLRAHVAKNRGMIPENSYAFLWVTDFPLLEYDEELERFVAVHHPFTSPLPEDRSLLSEAADKIKDVKSAAYDLVCNGFEIGGGSVRIHEKEIQEKMFELLGLQREEAKEKFGFLLEALSYGPPPHAGMAFGFDRCAMILSGAPSIRDVIAFPKTATASDLMSGAPTQIDDHQLEELSVKNTVVASVDEE